MPSPVLTKNNYRKAKCCGTCTHEKSYFCGILGIRVRPDMTCDLHEDDPVRATPRTECAACAFGPKGDHTCTEGCSRKRKNRVTSCYAGRLAKT